MNLNRGTARPAPAGGASRSNVGSGTASDAGVARAGSGLFGPLTRAANTTDTNSKNGAEDEKDKADPFKKKGKKDEGLSNDDDETAKSKSLPTKKAAGDGGDFKPMGGDDKNPWDANADKGNTTANNDTGAPDTPSGH